jgi:protein deglycase
MNMYIEIVKNLDIIYVNIAHSSAHKKLLVFTHHSLCIHRCCLCCTSLYVLPLAFMNYRSIVAFAVVGRTHAFNHQFSFFRSSFALRMSSTSEALPKRVLVPIADGSEEIETTCITDTLTRFGAHVTIASVMPNNNLVCTMSRGIKIMADMSIDEASKVTWDLVALPGGMPGAEHLRDSSALIAILEQQKREGKLYAAICASPAVVLVPNGLASEGMTCYPAPPFREVLTDPVDDDVVVTDNLTTSKGPGTSLKFALMLGEQMFGKDKADEIAAQMLVTR